MNELSRHIERILLTHDCVVVPHFGAFVTMAISATRDDGEQCFFPPLRVVRFNPSLLVDDGLLLTDVRASLNCSDVEGKRHIQHMVLELRQQLLSDGQVDFGSIGLFQQDEDGQVTFSPCQAGVVTPLFFGLDAFSMPKLTLAQRNDTGRGSHRKQMEQALEAESEHITIHIHKRSLKNIVAAAAIMILCVLFSSPIDESHPASNQATILPSEPIAEAQQQKAEGQKQAQQEEILVPQQATQAEEATATTETDAENPDKAEVKTAPASKAAQASSNEDAPNGNYCIVLASNVSLRNATAYVKTLKERGLSNARIYNNGKFNRVIIDGFQTENEAYEKNSELHRTNAEYANTWVMSL
ncbi:MAG: SPOR domain-containing protein [Bacteroidaceae bacterium]|nr:SPOR domain-containing protein [Bacteroidaceae bacterium]